MLASIKAARANTVHTCCPRNVSYHGSEDEIIQKLQANSWVRHSIHHTPLPWFEGSWALTNAVLPDKDKATFKDKATAQQLMTLKASKLCTGVVVEARGLRKWVRVWVRVQGWVWVRVQGCGSGLGHSSRLVICGVVSVVHITIKIAALPKPALTLTRPHPRHHPDPQRDGPAYARLRRTTLRRGQLGAGARSLAQAQHGQDCQRGEEDGAEFGRQLGYLGVCQVHV